MLFANRLPVHVRRNYTKDASAGMLGAAMFGAATPFFANIARDVLKASPLEIGLITMAPVAGNVLSFVWANLMEGKRKMPFAVASWVTARTLLCAAFFVTSAHLFVALVAMFWLITSIAGPAYTALMKEIYPDDLRGRIMGYVRVWSFLVMLVVTALAGWLLERVGYRYVFPVVGLMGVASAMLFSSIPTKERTGDATVPLRDFAISSVRILIEDKGYSWFCWGVFISGFAIFFATPVYTLYQVDVLGVHQVWSSVYTVATLGLSSIAYYFWGHMIDRKSASRIVWLSNYFFVGVPLVYCIAQNRFMLLPAMVLAGIGNAGCDLAYFSGVMHFAPKEKVTQYQALFAFLMGIRGIIAPYLGSMCIQENWLSMKQVFVLTAGLTLLSCPVLMIGYNRNQVEKKPLPASSR